VTEIVLPEIGTLALEEWPQNVFVWRLVEPVPSALFDEPVEATVFLVGDDDLDRVDLSLMATVLADLDRHLDESLRFLLETLLARPAEFGLTDADLPAYRNLATDDLPLDEPEVVFYTNDEWAVHFQAGDPPFAGPNGVVVEYNKLAPVRVDRLADDDEQSTVD
jgi:hypothetical protein